MPFTSQRQRCGYQTRADLRAPLPDDGPARGALRTPRCRAFTLIELLVVVAIIALLLAILLPSLSRARQMARRTYCASNMREIGKGLFYYAQKHNDFFPMIHGTDYEDPQPAEREWWEMLLPYKFRRKYMLCPSDPHRDDLVGDSNEGEHRIESYTFNGMFAFGKSFGQVIRPGDKICISERSDTEEGLEHMGYPAWQEQEAWEDLIKQERHHEKSNYLFVDLHVETLEWKETIGDGTDEEEDRHYLMEFDPPRPRPHGHHGHE